MTSIDPKTPEREGINSAAEYIQGTPTAHPPLSPATPAERFFLASLPTSDISAFALAANIRKNSRPFRKSSTSANSTCTDDFHSCVDNLEEYQVDQLRAFDIEHRIDEDLIAETEPEVTMRSPTVTATTPTPTPLKPKPETKNKPTPTVDKVEEVNLDPLQHAYGGIKNVWGFSCNFLLTKPFAKATETVAGKLLDMTTGLDFAKADKEIKPKLADFDDDVLNPVISSIVHFVEEQLQKGESIVRPIFMKVGPVVLGPFGFMKPAIEEEKENEGKGDKVKIEEEVKKSCEDHNATPEFTSPPAKTRVLVQ